MVTITLKSPFTNKEYTVDATVHNHFGYCKSLDNPKSWWIVHVPTGLVFKVVKLKRTAKKLTEALAPYNYPQTKNTEFTRDDAIFLNDIAAKIMWDSGE